jgi:hypothetical protein
MWVSHGLSYGENFLGRGEYLRTTARRLLARPYARVMVMHAAVIGGAFAVLWTGEGIGKLVILVTGKTAVDLASHLVERRRLGRKAPRPAGTASGDPGKPTP